MKIIKGKIIATLAPIAIIFIVIIASASVVLEPLSIAIDAFNTVGEWVFGKPKNDYIKSLELFLETDEGKEYVVTINQSVIEWKNELSEEERNNFNSNVPINALFIPLTLLNQSKIEADSVKYLLNTLYDEDMREKTLEMYIDLLRVGEPYQDKLNSVTTTTVVNYIKQFEDLQKYGGVNWVTNDDFVYPFTKHAYVTGEVGWYNPSGNNWEMHNGIDLAFGYNDTCGTPIYAVADGLVTMTDFGYEHKTRGYHAVIQSKNIQTKYFHMQSPTLVKPLQEITKGDFLGYVGNTGYSFGCHLHLEMRANNNEVINPRTWINFENPSLPTTNN